MRRVLGRIAVPTAIVVALAVGAPVGAVEKPELPISWLWELLAQRPTWANPTATLPRQAEGSATGREADYADTKEDGGAGRKATPVAKALGSYKPHDPNRSTKVTPEIPEGFDPATSELEPDLATRRSEVYNNADGTVTTRTYPRPVNFQDDKGDWKSIDVDLSRQPDGRLHAQANDLDTSVASRVEDPVTAESPTPSPSAAAPTAAPETAAQATALANLTLPTGESVGYTLVGAAPVDARVDRNLAVYPGILPSTDLELETFDTGIKETMVLHSPQAANSWIFPLQLDGLTPRIGPDGDVELRNASGEVVAWFPRGSMQDSRVDPRSGAPAESTAVDFELIEHDGSPALKVTADRAWLDDPARLYPVRVDPTATTATTGDVMIDNDSGTNNNGDNLPVGTWDGGTTKARSFLHFDDFDDNGFKGKRITAAKLKLYLTWAYSCDTDRIFHVRASTESWTVADLTSATSVSQSPSYSGSIGSLTVTDPGAACTNTAANRSVGKWVTVTLDPATIDGWSKGNPNYGLALTASETDSYAWKRFTSANHSSGTYKPVLELTYANNVAPQVNVRYPANNAVLSTLTPELLVKGSDADNWPAKGLTYVFTVMDPAGKTIATSPAVTGSWTVPSGKLAWNQTYLYTVRPYDQISYGASSPAYAFSTNVPQPQVTGSLAQNGGKGFDSSIGNYTTSATDANVKTVGPSLAVTRSYNSLDTRRDTAFGVGWASILDAKATQIVDAATTIQSVRVTYPTGSEVAFGRTSSGTYIPPSGRFATFVENKSGTTVTGYTLTDKDATVYTFGRATGTRVFRLTSVTDANGRTLSVAYGTDGNPSTLTSASGRKLTVGWSTPTGATAPHVATIATDRVDAADPASANTWLYEYSGDQLTTVCQPDDTTKCWRYGYESTSQYGNTVLNHDPTAYWPFGDAAGKTVGQSRVLANAGKDAARYNAVTLGTVGGPLAGGTGTVATFNGTSSYAQLPANLIADGQYQSVSMWFKTSTAGGVLLSYNADPMNKGTTTANYTPALYIDKSGKLRGEFWMGTATSVINSNVVVTDGKWHHVVLAGAGDTQTLYLDGAPKGTLAGTIYALANGANNINIGAGFVGGSWPDHANTAASPAKATYFTGQISDVALFNQAVTADMAKTLATAGTTAQPVLTRVNRPSGGITASVTYDRVSGRVSKVTDENGGDWTLSSPTVTGSSLVYAGAVLGAKPQDYWRMTEADAAEAVNEVAGGVATYSGVKLGGSGPFSDSTAGQFDGASSYVELPTEDIPGAAAHSIEMWFKLPNGNTTGGVLFSSQIEATDEATTGGWVPSLYVGTDGLLRGGSWTGSAANQAVSTVKVNDGKWHHVVLAAAPTTQTVYLDGKSLGAKTGTLSAFGAQHAYVGTGRWSGSWPSHGATDIGWWPGSIAEVAYFDNTLSDTQALDHFETAKQTVPVAMTMISGAATSIAMPVSKVTVSTPSQTTQISYFDLVNGNRLVAQTDERGKTTQYGYDVGGFSNMVYDPNGVLTQTLQDVRGNTIQSISCQDQSADKCSSVYHTYFPDATSTTLTPNPKNDLLLTVRDGRSASATDNTYLTTNAYDAKGNLTSVTDPLGRVTATIYTGAETAAADGGTPPAGLPTKITTPGGSTQTVTYYRSGDVAQITEPSGAVTRFTYDTLGRVITTTEISGANPAGLVTLQTYDRMDREVTQTDPAVTNRITGAVHTRLSTTAYDADGNILEVKREDTTGGDAPRVEKHTYNEYGQEVSSTTPGGATTRFTYDVAGRLILQTSPDGTVTESGYDAAGNLTKTWLHDYTGDPNDPAPPAKLLVAENTYDAAGRLATEIDAMRWITTHTYTDNGLEAKTIRSDGTTSFVLEDNSYDAAGNVVQEITGNGQTTVRHTYDAAGRETVVSAGPAGQERKTVTTYDADDNVLRVEQRDQAEQALSRAEAIYDRAGRVLTTTAQISAGNALVGRWKLDDGAGDRATDSAGNATATATGGVSWAAGRGGVAVFDGTGHLSSTATVLDTRRDFSVAAWVKLDETGRTQRFVSGGGGDQQSPFDISYDRDSGRWRFLVVGADSENTTSGTEALSTSIPSTGAWTHLTGTFDAATTTLRLYVNGTLESTTTGTVFAAAGPVHLGAGMWNGVLSDKLRGSLDDVQVYQERLDAAGAKAALDGTLPASAAKISRTSYTYDESDNVTSVTDPNGNTSYTSYDEDGSPVKTVAPAAPAESMKRGRADADTLVANAVSWTGYNTFGEVTDTEDALKNWSVTYYDADGRPTLQRSPGYTPPGGSTRIVPETIYTYTTAGQIQSITDPMGNVTRFEYDQLDRLSKTITADGGETEYTYDRLGDLLASTDPTGAVSSSTWNYLGQQVSNTQVVRDSGTAKPYTTTFEYDDNGRQTKIVSPAGVSRTTGYDAFGQVQSVKDAAGDVTSYTYDGAGRPVRTVRSDGIYQSVTYDMAGRTLTSGTYNKSNTLLAGTSTEYDAAGNTVAVIDPMGTRATYDYDATGLLVRERQPINSSDVIETTFGYDLEGNRTRFTNGEGHAFWTTYNSWGMVEDQIEPATPSHPDPADRTFTTSYDAGGRAVGQVQPGGVAITNTYDILGQLIGQAGSGAEADTVDRTFEYDRGGRVKNFSGVGGSNTITYDDRGLPLSIKGTSGDSTFAYNGDGAITSRTDAAGKTDFGYDPYGRLSQVTNASKGVDQTYQYDVRSTLQKITYAGGNSRNYTYDDLYRPVADELQTPAGASIAKIEYGWNKNSDLTSKKTTGFGGSGTITNSYTYDLADRLTSWNNGTVTKAYAYDKAGNRLQNGDKLFTYDARNRLVTGDGLSYSYTPRGTLRYSGTTETKTDAFGQVISQATFSGTGTQRYEYDALGRVVKDGFAYTGSDNDLAGDGQATYVRGAANEVIAESGTSGARYAWTDLHSDVVAQFTSAGTALDASVVYDPLGKVIGNTGSMIGSLGYQSEWTESSTSRINMMARWYNTDTGQFDTRDTASNSPVGNSVSANRYQYGDANPLTVTDPTGHIGLGSLWNKATSYVSAKASQATSYVSSYASSAYSYARSYTSYAYNTVRSTYTAAKTTYERAKKEVKKAVKKTVKRVSRAASKVKRAVSHGITKVKEKTKKFVRATVEKASRVTKAVMKKAKQAGKAVQAAAKRVVKNPVGAIKDAAKATAKFVVKHKDTILEVAAVGLAVVAGLACTAATAGAGAVACMVGAGALINLAKDAAQGDIHSIGDALGSLGTGALSGLAGGVGGAVAGKVGSLVAGKVGTGLAGRVATEAVENGVDGIIDQAVTTGRVDPRAAVMGMVPGLGALKKSAGSSTAGAVSSGGLPMATNMVSLGAVAGEGPGCATGPKPRTHSFEPDTQVLMADGSRRPIEDVNIGDEVVATDPETGLTRAEPVTQLHHNTDHEFTDVTVTDQGGTSATLNTTQNHPFWNETEQAWTDAAELQPGDELKVAGYGTVVVNKVHNYDDTKQMRDLTVADIHTYYVLAGTTPVLVHNCGNRTHDKARGAEGVDEMTATFERFNNRSDIYSETYGNGFEFWTPYGRRQVDIAIRNDSGGLDLYEVKVNKSNYTRGQRRKDEWLEKTYGFKTTVIRRSTKCPICSPKFP